VIGAILQFLTGGLVDKITDLGKAYLQRQVSEAEFRAEVEKATQEAAAKIEEGWAKAATQITAEVQASIRQSPVLQRAYAVTLFLQLAVLVFYQVGAPAYQVITGTAWPSPGVSLEWAYLLVAAMIGAGPLIVGRRA